MRFFLKPAELITYLSNDQLKIAETYFKKKDYNTAGFWAVRAFEKLLCEEGLSIFGFPPPLANGEIIADIKYLCKTKKYRFERIPLLKKLKKTIHLSKEAAALYKDFPPEYEPSELSNWQKKLRVSAARQSHRSFFLFLLTLIPGVSFIILMQ